MAKEIFKTIKEIQDFLDGTGYKIGVLGHNFISCAVSDRRCNKGWRIEFVIKIRVKSAIRLLDLFHKNKIADNAFLELKTKLPKIS